MGGVSGRVGDGEDLDVGVDGGEGGGGGGD